MALRILHERWGALSTILRIVRVREIKFAAVVEGERPAITIPGCLSSEELRGRLIVAKDCIGVASPLGDSLHVHGRSILEIHIHVGVWKVVARWTDVIWMICRHTEGAAVIVPA